MARSQSRSVTPARFSRRLRNRTVSLPRSVSNSPARSASPPPPSTSEEDEYEYEYDQDAEGGEEEGGEDGVEEEEGDEVEEEDEVEEYDEEDEEDEEDEVEEYDEEDEIEESEGEESEAEEESEGEEESSSPLPPLPPLPSSPLSPRVAGVFQVEPQRVPRSPAPLLGPEGDVSVPPPATDEGLLVRAVHVAGALALLANLWLGATLRWFFFLNDPEDEPKNARAWRGLLWFVILFAAAWLALPGSSSLANINGNALSLPGAVSLPSFSFPSIPFPAFSLPSIAFPAFSLPAFSLPSFPPSPPSSPSPSPDAPIPEVPGVDMDEVRKMVQAVVAEAVAALPTPPPPPPPPPPSPAADDAPAESCGGPPGGSWRDMVKRLKVEEKTLWVIGGNRKVVPSNYQG